MSWLERFRELVGSGDKGFIQKDQQERIRAWEEQILDLKRQKVQKTERRYSKTPVNSPRIIIEPRADPVEQGKLQRDLDIANIVKPIKPSVDRMLRIISDNTWGKGGYDWVYTEFDRNAGRSRLSPTLASWSVGQFWKNPYGYGYYDLELTKSTKSEGQAHFIGRGMVARNTELSELEALLLHEYSLGPKTYTPTTPPGRGDSLYPAAWSSGDPFKGG